MPIAFIRTRLFNEVLDRLFGSFADLRVGDRDVRVLSVKTLFRFLSAHGASLLRLEGAVGKLFHRAIRVLAKIYHTISVHPDLLSSVEILSEASNPVLQPLVNFLRFTSVDLPQVNERLLKVLVAHSISNGVSVLPELIINKSMDYPLVSFLVVNVPLDQGLELFQFKYAVQSIHQTVYLTAGK